jgi:hypothetical protein
MKRRLVTALVVLFAWWVMLNGVKVAGPFDSLAECQTFIKTHNLSVKAHCELL